MKPIGVVLTLHKETKGSIHYKAEQPEGLPVWDVYVRKIHFEDRTPPQRILLKLELPQ